MDQELTRRQRRLLKKEEQARVRKPAGRHVHGWHVVGLVLVVGLIGAVVYSLRSSRQGYSTDSIPSPTTYTAGPVHWHAAFEVELCGQKQDFSSYGATSHAGSPLFHTHGDSLIHIEGRIIQKDDIALGKFFDLIDVPFGPDRIMDKKNGDTCVAGGSPGKVKMFINGEPNQEFRDYIPKPTEKGEDQKIRIVFE